MACVACKRKLAYTACYGNNFGLKLYTSKHWCIKAICIHWCVGVLAHVTYPLYCCLLVYVGRNQPWRFLSVANFVTVYNCLIFTKFETHN